MDLPIDQLGCCRPRREFLRVGALSLLGLNLRQYLALEAATSTSARSGRKAQACILLWLEGGPLPDRHLGPQAP